MGKLSTRSGNAILGAALIDDVLGIVGSHYCHLPVRQKGVAWAWCF
jgi:Kef-type K+ transport system membrane component KefB